VGLVAPYLLAVAIDFDDAVIDAAGHEGVAVGQAGYRDRAIDAGLPELVAFPVELDDGLLVVKRHKYAAVGQDLDVASQRLDGPAHVKAFQFASLRVEELAASAGGGDGELAVAQALGRRDIAVAPLVRVGEHLLALAIDDHQLLPGDDQGVAVTKA